MSAKEYSYSSFSLHIELLESKMISLDSLKRELKASGKHENVSKVIECTVLTVVSQRRVYLVHSMEVFS